MTESATILHSPAHNIPQQPNQFSFSPSCVGVFLRYFYFSKTMKGDRSHS